MPTRQHDPELVIGLVSAVGTESSLVIDLLIERLGCAGYVSKRLKVSEDVIPRLVEVADYGTCKFQRISNLMDAGNDARQKTNKNEVLALGIAAHIYSLRDQADAEIQVPLVGEPSEKTAFTKTAIIVDSLKRPEEVETLRRVYPSGFVLVGVHAEESRRRRRLVADLRIPPDKADFLIQRDGEEAKEPYGQRVNKTFHLADFFVRIGDNHDQLRGDVTRMVELWFGNPFVTPTFDEHAMFLAFASALRSADLSRQVGAVIARDSQILATGANDCPRPGGGLYWPFRGDNGCIEDEPRGRDFKRVEGDSNRAELNRLIDQIVAEGRKSNVGIEGDKLRGLLQSSGLRDLTEFGRVVHAEMEALMCCARNGMPTVGATIYCTTFPCHNCAKHIVAAGIARVVYVEPYPKSKALELHDDSIDAGAQQSTDGKKVRFEPFVGIGPRRFFDLFSMHLGASYPLERKDNTTGLAKKWRIEEARLRIQMQPISYLGLELEACDEFLKVVDEPGISGVASDEQGKVLSADERGPTTGGEDATLEAGNSDPKRASDGADAQGASGNSS